MGLTREHDIRAEPAPGNNRGAPEHAPGLRSDGARAGIRAPGRHCLRTGPGISWIIVKFALLRLQEHYALRFQQKHIQLL